MREPPVVCMDPDQACSALAAGRDVVLVAAPTVASGAAVAALLDSAASGGRLAVMAGDPGEPGVLAAAAEMAAEVFGRDAPSAEAGAPSGEAGAP